MKVLFDRFKNNIWIKALLLLLFALWAAVYFYLFFSKGIFVNDIFYKKSANINTITYTSTEKSVTPQRIILKKQIGDSSLIIADEKEILIKLSENITEGFEGIDADTLMNIAKQNSETYRGSKSKIVLIASIALLLAVLRLFIGKIYSALFKNRIPSENFYNYFDLFLGAYIVFCVVFLSLTL